MLFQKHLWSLVRASLWSKPGCRHASLLVLPDYYAHRPSASQSCLGQDLYQVSFTPNCIELLLSRYIDKRDEYVMPLFLSTQVSSSH